MKEGWEYKKLGEVCQSDLGKTLNKSKDKGELYPYLCAINILWDKIDLSTLKQTRFEKDELERYSVKKGDLLICEGGDIGRAAIWDKEESILYQNALHRVRLEDNVNARFCLLFLQNLKQNGILDNRYGKGVTIKHLVKSALLSIPIPVPPLSEQRQIVEELDLLSSIIEKKKAQINELDNMSQSLFHEMFGNPITNEKGWIRLQLKDKYNVKSSKRVYQSEQSLFGVPFLRVADIISKINKEQISPQLFISEELYSELKANELVPKAGDILVTSRGTLGRSYIVEKTDKFYFQDGMITWLESKSNDVNPLFVNHLLETKEAQIEMKKSSNTSTVAFISINRLAKMMIPIPPIDLQNQFAERVETIEHLKELIKKSIKEVETLFNSRMDYFFN